MPARYYSASFEGQTWAAADTDIDLFELTPGDDNPIEVVGLFIEPYSEVADAAEEILRFHVLRGHATSGSTPDVSPTPQPLPTGTQAASFTVEAINSTIASAGTAVTLHAGAFNVRVGLQLWLPEGCEWGATQADTTLVVRSSSTVADDLNLNATIYVREYGP
jgi:hypothetical protein